MELKIRVAKIKCMGAIRQRALAKRNHTLVISELKQRTNLAKCVRDINTGSYYLSHIKSPVEISSIVMIKQQMHLRRVNMVIKQAGLKIKLNRELTDRQDQCNRKTLLNYEIRLRFATASICEEVRSKVQLVQAYPTRGEVCQEDCSNFMMDREQSDRYREVVKEINTRSKQIFWKQQTCTIIKQGGLKVRVNKVIRSIARQRYLKNQINILIKQAGLKSRLQKEIRQLRVIACLKKQRDLKLKVNTSICRMGKVQEVRSHSSTQFKRKALKAISYQGTQHGLSPMFTPQFKQKQMSQEDVQRGLLFKGAFSSDDEEDEVVSCRRLAMMKLIESVARVSETGEKQEKVIRRLTEEITLQKADFAELNTRVVNEKNLLYHELELLEQENVKLTKILSEQIEKEKLLEEQSSKQNKSKEQHRQHQQTPVFYQEMQVFKTHSPIVRGEKHQEWRGELNRPEDIQTMTQHIAC